MVVMLGMGRGVGGIKFVSFSFPMVMSSWINKSQSSQSTKVWLLTNTYREEQCSLIHISEMCTLQNLYFADLSFEV
jgi:hypothetical protein